VDSEMINVKEGIQDILVTIHFRNFYSFVCFFRTLELRCRSAYKALMVLVVLHDRERVVSF
jgi:hypothetical protein